MVFSSYNIIIIWTMKWPLDIMDFLSRLQFAKIFDMITLERLDVEKYQFPVSWKWYLTGYSFLHSRFWLKISARLCVSCVMKYTVTLFGSPQISFSQPVFNKTICPSEGQTLLKMWLNYACHCYAFMLNKMRDLKQNFFLD